MRQWQKGAHVTAAFLFPGQGDAHLFLKNEKKYPELGFFSDKAKRVHTCVD
ncbi:hypothetical protein [Desulfovibrio sp. An276]|uniref:hypothetical protein n=1 Tax=Desulfovibrio sp. An276 TaxID=1965618 RepID=UPI0013A654DE|nr:hypothetical protein [Desulfovibrio sp. An276]